MRIWRWFAPALLLAVTFASGAHAAPTPASVPVAAPVTDSAPAAIGALVAVPKQTARVVDTIGLMQPQQAAALEAVLAEYEQAKGTQIAVLTVSSTAPEPIEQFGIRVADAWKTGRKNVSDGVILIVARDNPRDLRRLRIEVGYGLEGAIPDAIAKRIIDQDIAPHFRQNDYYGGLVAGVQRIQAALEHEALPPVEARAAEQNSGWNTVLFVLFVIVVAIVSSLRRRGVTAVSGGRGVLPGIIIGNVLSSVLHSRGGGGGGGGFGGGFGGGGGGGFGGGGASGDW